MKIKYFSYQLLFAICTLFFFINCINDSAGNAEAVSGEINFSITSNVIDADGFIPIQFTCDGPDFSPPLFWSDAPQDTKSFAIICDDNYAPGKTWVHWVIFNIPTTASRLPDGVTITNSIYEEIVQGKNDFGDLGYGGPCPPKGHGVHKYYFKIYALDQMIELKEGVTKKELVKAMKGHILDEAEFIGKYERQ
ncbi:MAG: YbhB/YbcL family Raf kinase inhibitor-like protein [Bacteroidetes bacterium]|nr:YbhB/YbcL family Raf kinase inhibitor-like protein [Bacteroidota bacterium]